MIVAAVSVSYKNLENVFFTTPYHCRNLLFSLFLTRYRFEPSNLFSFSYVTALGEFPRLLFSATQFFTNYANRLFFVGSETTAQFGRRAAVQTFLECKVDLYEKYCNIFVIVI